jgi:hypothetical protein
MKAQPEDQAGGVPVELTLGSDEAREAFAQMTTDLDELYTLFSVLSGLAAAIRGAENEATWQRLHDATKTLLPDEFSGISDFTASVRGVNGDELGFAWSIASVLKSDRARGLTIIKSLYQHVLLRAIELSMQSTQALIGFGELLQAEAFELVLVKLSAPRRLRGKKEGEVKDEGSST